MIKKEKVSVAIENTKIKLNVVRNVEELLAEAREEWEIPFWAELWPSSIGLARYLWSQITLDGLTVLELGAGLGLPGIVAAKKGALVTQTDFMPEAIKIAEENAALNKVQTQSLMADWRAFPIKEKFDVIIGSDILYEPLLHNYLKKIFQENLTAGGRIYLADPGRESARDFVNKMKEDGYQVHFQTFNILQRALNYHITIYCLQSKLMAGNL